VLLTIISDLDILKAIKLKPQSVALDGAPGTIINGCLPIFAPLPKYIFDLSLSQEHFPMQWKKAVIVHILKKKAANFPSGIVEPSLF
jgi:hypothetical protein